MVYDSYALSTNVLFAKADCCGCVFSNAFPPVVRLLRIRCSIIDILTARLLRY